MEAKAIVTYVVCDDVIKNLNIKEDKQTKMTIAEVMTTAIIAAIQYSGNLEKARKALKSKRYIPNMLSKSQLNRRLHKIENGIWGAVLQTLSATFKKYNIQNEFVIDSCPIYGCKQSRRGRNKIHSEKKYLGYCASQDQYFIGLKLHMVCDITGIPVEFIMLPASESDLGGLKKMKLDLPPNSSLIGDKIYNDYAHEDRLVQEKQVHLLPIRKKNSKRKGGGYLAKIRSKKRKIIETVFSCIGRFMPRAIHAVTKAGFELKALLFVLAYAFNRMIFEVTT